MAELQAEAEEEDELLDSDDALREELLLANSAEVEDDVEEVTQNLQRQKWVLFSSAGSLCEAPCCPIVVVIVDETSNLKMPPATITITIAAQPRRS